MNTIAERINAVVSESGLTKTAFAKQLNVTQQYVSNLCLGKKNPSDRTILDICREFNVNEAWLRTGEGEMFLQSEESAVARLCAELHASELEAEIIRAYFRIDERIRDELLRRLIQEVQKASLFWTQANKSGHSRTRRKRLKRKRGRRRNFTIDSVFPKRYGTNKHHLRKSPARAKALVRITKKERNEMV